MDRAAFENVYLNANCIAEIGLVRAMLGLADAPPESQAAAAVPAAPIAEDESALDGVLGIGELTPEQLAQQVARVEAMMRGETGAPDDAPAETFGEAIGVGALDPDWGEPDVGLYLDQALSSRDALQPRIDAAFARADQMAMDAALAALPANAPPIAGVLDAAGLETWLALYDGGHAALTCLVTQVRGLDPVF